MAYTRNREYLKAYQWEEWDDLETDQKADLPHPQAQKPVPENASLIDLIPPDEFGVGNLSVRDAIGRTQEQA